MLPATYVGARVVSVVWRPDGGRGGVPRRRSCCCPTCSPADELRQLRVALRYGRAPVEDGRAEAGASAGVPGAVGVTGGVVRVAASGARVISGDVAG